MREKGPQLRTPAPDITDQQILVLLQDKGHYDQGFRLLIQAYQEKLYWQIRRLVVDHDDANDVLQNCMLKVYRNIKGFKGNSSLYTWLYRIATNEAITFLKQRQRRSASSIDDEELLLANQLKADPYFDGEEVQIKLQQAIQQLPEKQLLVFNMRYFEEMSYQEMSTILNTSVGALKASYHHAVKKIEQYFKSVDV